jgi:hypothetical protein
MKSFFKEKVKIHTNACGEVMTMKLDSSGNLTVLHEDCNKSFEPIMYFITNYVLTTDEQKAAFDFIVDCRKYIESKESWVES